VLDLDGMGKNILLPLLIDAQWSKALKIIADDQSVAKKWITTQSFTGSIYKTEILPIHQVCSTCSVQFDIVSSLANAYPGSLFRRESGTGRTPLHIAIRARVSDDVIALIIGKCPDSVELQDSLGRVPLHYACSNQIPKVTIDRLLEASPESIRATDNLGWTPLHVASSKYQSVDVVEDMLRVCPEGIFDVTSLGNRPVMTALSNLSDAKEPIIRSLELAEEKFQEMPAFKNIRAAEKRNAMSEKTKDANSVVYSAIRNSQTWGIRKRVRSNSVRRVV